MIKQTTSKIEKKQRDKKIQDNKLIKNLLIKYNNITSLKKGGIKMNNEIQLNKKIQEIEELKKIKELKEIKEKFEFNDVEEYYFYCNDYVKFEKDKSNLHKDIKKQRYKKYV